MKSFLQNKVRLLLVLPFLLFHFNSYGQQTITGTVIDDQNNPLPGVNILVKGTDQGTSTTSDGTYAVSAPSLADSLVFSFVGYQTQVVAIQGRTHIDVQLISQTYQGGELVVIGYGTQRKEEITSAVSNVDSKDFIQSSPKDAASLIKGKVAGLVISSPSGNPTAGTEIQLRGTTTLEASSSPLVLIDGVPGDLNTVAPEDIDNISVLKDGSSAAIYGSRGSNGVILITTKKHEGARAPTINYQAYVNTQQIIKIPDFMSAKQYRNAIQQYDANFTDYNYNTDWINQVLRDNPVSQNHTITLSGGDATSNYSASLNYTRANGIFKRSDNEDIRGRVNVNHSMFDNRLEANVDINYRTQSFFNGSNDNDGFNENVWYQALIRNPTDQIKDSTGSWQERPGFNYDNPVAMLQEVNGNTENRELRLNGTLTFDPVDHLSLKVLGSSSRWSQLIGYAETFQNHSTTVDNINGYASRNENNSTDNLFEFTGTYQNDVGQHSFNVLGGYSYENVIYEGFGANNRDFPTDLYTYNDLGSGSGLQDGLAGISSYKNSYKLIGFFGRLNYDYDNRYIIMGSMRYEGNSKFGANNKWGLFPAISAGWRISNEAFMQNVAFINDLKLRAGYGVTGIAPGSSYQSLASFSFGGFFDDGGTWVRGLQPSRNANPDLRWERKEEINLGVDFSVLNERLYGSIDVYKRETKDLLFNYSVPSPPYLYNNILANVGEMSNKGLEVSLNFDVLTTNDLIWTSGVNYSTNKNKLVSLSNDLYQSDNNYIDTGGLGESVQLPTHRIFVGGQVGNFYGYKSIDIDENGLWIVEGADGQPKNYFDIDLDDRQVIGNGVPKHNISWNNTVRYKNFDLSVFLRGAFDFQILNVTRLFYTNPTQTGINLLNSAFDKIYDKHILANEWQYMSYYIEDGDYVKLDNITLGYSFDVTKLMYVKQARIYVSGQNLYTFTGYSGLDPEVPTAGLAPGVDGRATYPTTRTFTLGVNLTF